MEKLADISAFSALSTGSGINPVNNRDFDTPDPNYLAHYYRGKNLEKGIRDADEHRRRFRDGADYIGDIGSRILDRIKDPEFYKEHLMWYHDALPWKTWTMAHDGDAPHRETTSFNPRSGSKYTHTIYSTWDKNSLLPIWKDYPSHRTLLEPKVTEPQDMVYRDNFYLAKYQTDYMGTVVQRMRNLVKKMNPTTGGAGNDGVRKLKRYAKMLSNRAHDFVKYASNIIDDKFEIVRV